MASLQSSKILRRDNKFKMTFITILLFATIACAFAQTSMDSQYAPMYPDYLYNQRRYRRDLTWDKSIGDNGNIFATLGQTDQFLPYGKAGYQHQFFDDASGTLTGQGYGSRVLGPDGGSTNFGGRLDWHDENAKAALDLSKSLGGDTGLTATGQGLWHLGKNTELSAGGGLTLGHGKPDYGFVGNLVYRW